LQLLESIDHTGRMTQGPFVSEIAEIVEVAHAFVLIIDRIRNSKDLVNCGAGDVIFFTAKSESCCIITLQVS
jgi:hypothetical protein